MEGYKCFLLILLQLALIALNAIFASAEIAFVNASESKLEKFSEEGSKRAKKLLKLKSKPAKFLATVQVAITLSGFLGSAFAAENFAEPITEFFAGIGFPVPEAAVVVLITFVLSYITLVFGELVPKRTAMRNPEKLALSLTKFIGFLSKLFSPLVWILTVSTNAVLRMIGIDPNETNNDVSEEDIRDMVDSAAKSSQIDDEERDFIQNIFEFDDMTAGDIATHRTDVTFLWLDDSDDEWSEIIHEKCHMFYPVCKDSVDDVVGVLYLKDYFRLADRTRENVLEKAVKSPYFVPESVKADVLFRNMKKLGRTFGVVIDEYGGMLGIVTMNDLITQLVGDLGGDEPSDEKPKASFEQISELSWKLIGNAELEDIAEATKCDLPIDGFDTFSGMVFSELGSIPDDGTAFELEAWGLHIEVTSVLEHQIEEATVTRLEPFPADDVDGEAEE